MRPMAIRPECYACLERLLALTVELATPDGEVRRQAHRAARRLLDRDFGPAAIPARIANRVLPVIHHLSGNADPFGPRKVAATALAARLHRRLAPACGEDLESLLKFAALGNALDFFRGEAEVTREMLARVEFAIFHGPEFRQALAGPPGLLLYLADNAGEQFFDRPLVVALRRRGWQALYVVKGGPIQNDLTREDLEASGLREPLEPVADTGARTVGLQLDEASPGFRELYAAAQVIVAKGMGHFETMSHLGDRRVWFLLQAKCVPVAQALGVSRNAFVFSRTPPLSSGDQDDYHVSEAENQVSPPVPGLKNPEGET
ncbi:MAG: ARMT1-like domain-containing protein [Desulfobaccales bacterium]